MIPRQALVGANGGRVQSRAGEQAATNPGKPGPDQRRTVEPLGRLWPTLRDGHDRARRSPAGHDSRMPAMTRSGPPAAALVQDRTVTFTLSVPEPLNGQNHTPETRSRLHGTTDAHVTRADEFGHSQQPH